LTIHKYYCIVINVDQFFYNFQITQELNLMRNIFVGILALSALTTAIVAPSAHAQAVNTQVTSNSSETKILSFTDNDYKMYLRVTGLPDNDTTHVQFNTERNAYLSGNTSTPTPPPTTTTPVVTIPASSGETKILSYTDYDYKMYLRVTGLPDNDTTHVQFNTERNAYLSGKTSTPPTTTPVASGETKILSYTDYDYKMYLRVTGLPDNDTTHVQFNTERNAYLSGKTSTPTPPTVTSVEPTTQAKPQKPSLTYKNRNSVKKPNYRTIVKPGVRKMTIKVIRIYQY
jgi:hypothetical protein